MKKRAQVLMVVVVVCLLTASASAEMPVVSGAIAEVTVYRGQALVTRSINVELAAGASEVIVGDLPGKIIPESLYAQTLGDIQVLSVRYREKAIKDDTREGVKTLDAKIEAVAKQLGHANSDLKHLHSQWDNMFSKLRGFTVEAANIDLNRGLLTFEPISQLTTFIEEKGLEYHQRATELRDQIGALKKELDLLKRRRKKLDAGRSRTEREAVLFVRKTGNKKVQIKLSYLVKGANWLPQYNLRANPDKSSVLIEYNAVVNQTSGEDWNGVALSLSTAEPAMVAGVPALEPMTVVLASMGPGNRPQAQSAGVPFGTVGGGDAGYVDQFRYFSDLAKDRREQGKKGASAQKELNRLASTSQNLDLVVSREALERMKERISEIARIEGVSVTYNLPGELTLPSRTDQQLVTVAAITAEADFTLVATPLLTDYVYLQAELLNKSDVVLLPGPASMFRNGEFVGKSDLSIVTVGERFTAGFGIDSQVQVVRELEDKKTRIQGGNRIDTYHYRIALNNYRSTTAELRLLDRLPSTDDSSIKIELLKTDPELSTDAEYLRTLRRKGILRWDMELKANAVEKNATVLNYSFTMEYDRNMQIQARPAVNQ